MRRTAVLTIGGLAVPLLLAFALPPLAIDRPTVALIGWMVEALVWLIWVSIRGAKGRAALAVDLDPPDGLVPIVALTGLDARPIGRRGEVAILAGAIERSGDPGRPRNQILRTLRGRIGVVSLYVGRDGRPWSDLAIERGSEAVESMGKWLEREAMRHGVGLNLERVGPCLVADDPDRETVELATSLDPFESVIDEVNPDLKALASASRAARALGCDGLADLVERVERRARYDAVVWVIFLGREGRSRAVPRSAAGILDARIAIIHAVESTTSAPLTGSPLIEPATLAHEILHLFGAEDKYGISLSSFPKGSVPGADIMRLTHDRLGRLRIGPLTAFEIGWPAAIPGQKKTRPTREELDGPSADRKEEKGSQFDSGNSGPLAR